jgi:hypothetical protein
MRKTHHTDTRPTEAHLIQAIRAARTVGANGLTTEEAQLLGAFASGSLFVRDDIESAFSNGVTFCADCEKLVRRGDGCGTGYACLTGKEEGKRVCYSCADERQRANLLDRSAPFCAYLSNDGKQITTWTGGRLMGVTASVPCKLSRMSYTHGKDFRTVWARDVHGGEWYGRGSPGICIKLRPTKNKN